MSHIFSSTPDGYSLARLNNALQGSYLGDLEEVKHEIVSVSTADWVISGLDGNTHIQYLLRLNITNGNAASPAIYTLQPNGLTTNQTHTMMQVTGGVAANSSAATIYVGYASPSKSIKSATSIYAATGGNRYFNTLIQEWSVAVATGFAFVGSKWTEQVTNLTSFTIHSSVATGVGVNSELTLYRIK